jgi:hypothetical protein
MDDDATDDLYALPLEEFVPARDALAKELRRDKRRVEAAEIAALQKPTRPAWMVNQLSRTEGALTAKLLECAEALAEAQETAVSGEGARDLRAAGRAERQAVERLMEAARGLRPEGRSPSTAMLERVRVTLQAAAGDEELRERIRLGRLVEEPAAGGAWPLPGWGAPAAGDTEATPKASAGRTAKRSTTRTKGDSDEAASTRRRGGTSGTDTGRRTGRRPTSGATTEARRREAHEPSEVERAATADRRREEEREQAERDRAEEAKRRAELQSALRTAKKTAREAARERERARRDADRAAERLERLAAEVVSAQEAADGATARRELTEAAANEAEAEVARLEAELRPR